ncbi:hypothetical protein HR11_08535 [Porphyromonas macacae]|uniref:sugar-transfer associated ATP-grasp domain-containing protein n=1 Tax=Porphyromonas macacae TaxID=28115 RepID=UPI00052C71F0|nr:sugar-transfer associated ATP-grasp domain-containing protein [Porphyromonas macacae]KGN98569.1 hypothetical protein HR11_08535 [Porphyromonas macacae]
MNTKTLIKSFVVKRWEKRIGSQYSEQFRKERRKIQIDKKLSTEQKKEIKKFYKRVWGKKVNTMYHEYYIRNGLFSPNYIPVDLYRSKIVYRLNDFRMKDAYVDKNIFEKIFGNMIKHPKTILRRINGLYYNGNYQTIKEEEAIILCSNLSNVIIKPSIETTNGDRVKLISIKDGVIEQSKQSLIELFTVYGKHFIIQKQVEQHDSLFSLNPSSTNTIRILTYRREETKEIVPLYSALRIGRKGKIVDNVGSGGFSVKISSDGVLQKYGYSIGYSLPFEYTDTGIKLEGYRLPFFERIIHVCKELHNQLPYFDLAGWDISIDKGGEPVLIEWNVSPDLLQSAGPAFREYTEEILKRVRKSKTTRYLKLVGESFR